MKWCKMCGERVWGNKCPCQPWKIWSEDQDEGPYDARVFHASSPADAAEKWAEYTDADSSDYTIVGRTSEVVCVANAATGDVVRIRVSGETVAQYSAKVVG